MRPAAAEPASRGQAWAGGPRAVFGNRDSTGTGGRLGPLGQAPTFRLDVASCAHGALMAMLEPSQDEPGAVANAFWLAVGTNLKEGRIRLVFVADEIPASLQRLVEFLNEQMPRVEVLAVEIRQHRAGDGRAGALVPRLIGQTSRAQAAKERPATAARRPAPWTADEVLEAVAQAGGPDAAAVAEAVISWAAAHPHIQVGGGTGLSYPSVTLSADSGRARSRYRWVLSLYGSPHEDQPVLEVRVKRMCRTPPYNRAEDRGRLTASLRALGIPRLDAEATLEDKRPNIPLDELTGGRVKGLLAVVEQWIADVRARVAEPEPDEN